MWIMVSHVYGVDVGSTRYMFIYGCLWMFLLFCMLMVVMLMVVMDMIIMFWYKHVYYMVMYWYADEDVHVVILYKVVDIYTWERFQLNGSLARVST